MKYCPKCKTFKPEDRFSRATRTLDGLQVYCKDCNAAYREANRQTINQRQRLYNEKNKDEISQRRRERYADNPEPQKRASQAYRDENREVVRDRQRERRQSTEGQEKRRSYYARMKEWLRQRWKEYSVRRRDYLRSRTREWYHRNKDRARAKHQAWRRSNPENARRRGHEYRARQRGASGRYTEAQWIAMLDWFGHVCLRCGTTQDITIDHVVPLLMGGTNDISNLQPLCRSCNSIKRNKTADYRDPDMLAAFLDSIDKSQ